MRLALGSLVLLAVAALATQVGTAASGRASHTTVPQSAIFWNAHDGLLGVRECGAGGHSCNGGGIEVTTDGGRSYRLVRRTRDGGVALYKVGSRGAIAQASTGGGVLLTLDRGRTWKRVHSGMAEITWATPRIGLRTGLGKSGLTVKLSATHDGGRTWQSLRSPCHGAARFLAFASLPTPKRWWLNCVGIPQGTTAEAIFSTRNAGRSWKPGASTGHGGLSGRGVGGGIEFAPDGFGFLDGNPIHVTRNGGMGWTKLPSKLSPEAALAGGLGYALSRGHNPLPQTLLVTRDSGRTWHPVRRWDG